MAKSDDSITHGRRTFFKEAFAKLIEPVAEYLDEQISPYFPAEKVILRPPGALSEADFLNTCLHSGNCIDSCPAQAIHPLPNGTPHIDPDYQPCVVCESLACMQACPSGALQKLSVEEIQIGVAVVNYETCLRTEEIDCTYCVDNCPIGDTAIRLDSQERVEVIFAGCVGCGLCQYHCPTAPKSIVIQPLG